MATRKTGDRLCAKGRAAFEAGIAREKGPRIYTSEEKPYSMAFMWYFGWDEAQKAKEMKDANQGTG